MDSDRRSAQVERLEVVDQGRRRRWSEDEKLKIVLESLADCKIGEDVTETLELVPRQWKVIQHVREKFSCRACEAISQPPAPFHPISRGRAGPRLLAHILFGKYGLHLPLNRQSTTYAHEGVALDVSTLADWVGAAAATLTPLVEMIKAH